MHIFLSIKKIIAKSIYEKIIPIEVIKKLYLAPGYIDHITYMMLAESLKPSSLVGDEPEDLEIIPENVQEAQDLHSKLIIDAIPDNVVQ